MCPSGPVGRTGCVRSVVVTSRSYSVEPRRSRMAGLPGSLVHDAAKSDLHQLLEAVEARWTVVYKNAPSSAVPKRCRGQHGVLLRVDAQADIVEPAGDSGGWLLQRRAQRRQPRSGLGAVRVTGRRAVVAASQNSVVADNHGHQRASPGIWHPTRPPAPASCRSRGASNPRPRAR